MASPPRLWLLFGTTGGDNAQLLNLARNLGWPFEIKRVVDGVGMTIIDRIAMTCDPFMKRKKTLLASLLWPDAVLIAGGRRVADAVRIKEMSNGRTRIICIGRPWANLDLFDLIITTPQYQLPARPNILQNSMPLNRPSDEALRRAAAEWKSELAHLPGPKTAVIVGGNSGSCRFTPESAADLAAQANAHAKNQEGSLLVTTSSRTPKDAADRLIAALDVPHAAYRWDATATRNPYFGFLALADDFLVTSDSASMAAEAISTGKPVRLFDVPIRLRSRLMTRRHQTGLRWQRMRDELTRRGFWVPARDIKAFQQQLVAEGYVQPPGQKDKLIRQKKPGDLERAIAAIQALFPRLALSENNRESLEIHETALLH